MALADDIALNGDSYSGTTEGSKTFTLVNRPSSGALRRVSGTYMNLPNELTISHQELTRSGIKRSRDLARIDQKFDDTDEGEVGAAVYIVVDRPIGLDVTADQIKAMLGRLVALTQVSGFQDDFLNGES